MKFPYTILYPLPKEKTRFYPYRSCFKDEANGAGEMAQAVQYSTCCSGSTWDENPGSRLALIFFKGMVVYACNTRTLWPARLGKLVNSSFSERTWLKI